MRVGRNIIISAILALGASGSILASAAVPTVVAQASSAHVLAVQSYGALQLTTLARSRPAIDGAARAPASASCSFSELN